MTGSSSRCHPHSRECLWHRIRAKAARGIGSMRHTFDLFILPVHEEKQTNVDFVPYIKSRGLFNGYIQGWNWAVIIDGLMERVSAQVNLTIVLSGHSRISVQRLSRMVIGCVLNGFFIGHIQRYYRSVYSTVIFVVVEKNVVQPSSSNVCSTVISKIRIQRSYLKSYSTVVFKSRV